MIKQSYEFSSKTVNYYFNVEFSQLNNIVPVEKAIIITDEHIAARQKMKLKGWKVIVLKAGEAYKNQQTVDNVIDQLIELGADRKTVLIGVGGGVVTDITGYVAGIFMRGINFGFVPTTILAMVDASIGGKNGVDVGLYKNLVGLIRQPSFLFFDFSLLKTLPKEEWINGFAEIIKHACILDKAMFKSLQQSSIATFKKDPKALFKLVQRNALLKTKVVIEDEFEQGNRKLLNFGHTMGHAIENLYQIPHGHAISIGMGVACELSEKLVGFKQTADVKQLLKSYGLPPDFVFDKEQALRILKTDKKKDANSMNYVVLEKIGKASVVPVPIDELENMIKSL